MKNRFEEKHLALLKAADPEVTDFYTDWLCMRESNEFETTAHLLAHLAREILRGLQDRVPEDVGQIYNSIIHFFDKFSHRREGGKAPRPKESFNQTWIEFESLLVYLVEIHSDFYNISNHCPFATLQNSLKQLETETSKSLKTEWIIPDIELLPYQSEISQNLEKIAPLFAAFYRDWVRMLRSTNFQCRSYMLAHLAREVDSGLRGALSTKRGQKQVQEQLKKADLGGLKEHVGYIASIMEALGVPDFGLRVEQWIQTVKDLKNLTHRDLDDEAKLHRNEVESLWPKVEELWVYLVGSYLKLLNRVDRILGYKCEPPTDEQIKEALRNLLEFEGINQYFFDQLESPAWLKILKEDGRFDPKNNPAPQESPDQPGYYYSSRWHALEYVVKISTHSECPVNIVVDIVNTITDEDRERIDNGRTDLDTVKIIGTLPIDRIEPQHINFMGAALKSTQKYGLMDQEIGQTILPKLLDGGEPELTLALLTIMLEVRSADGRIRPIMDEYWLENTLKEHGQAIANVCGLEAAQIVLAQIRMLITADKFAFHFIKLVESDLSLLAHADYTELVVSFTSCVFQSAESDNIKETVQVLLNEPHTIIKGIAVKAINHHYSNLKHLFWEWDGNPLEEISLKPELYQLIQTNCNEFKESEIEQILDWIELAQYTAVFAKDDETRSKAAAYKKREWLSALLETGNEKAIAANEKYKKINPEKIENPGSLFNIEVWAGSASPLTVEELFDMSNTQIAEFLVNFKEVELVISKSDPTEDGLAKTFNKCIAETPQRYTNNLQPFQNVQNFYQQWMLHGFLKAWRDKKEFDWAALLEYIHQLLLSERFWTEQHTTDCNYRQWTLVAIADLIASRMENDEREFDAQLLPLAEQVLLILVKKVEPGDFSCINRLSDIQSSDRSKVFSAVINYALRFAFINDITQGNCRWPQAIKEDFTRRLNRNLEPSPEFFYTLGAYLPDLSYLDEEWVRLNINCIFPQQDEKHWQAAFSGYLLHSGVREEFHALLKAHGHYQRALSTHFTDAEVLNGLVRHICTGWIEDSEPLDDKTSLIYQLIHGGNPNLLAGVVYFFSRRSDNLSDKVKVKVMPAWRALFEILSKVDDTTAYQKVSCPLLRWLELVDTIDAEVLGWVKGSIEDIDKVPGYGMVLSRFIKALRKHILKTPRLVGEIYLAIPQRVMKDLQMEENEIKETVRILYNNGNEGIAEAICEQFAKADALFLRPVSEEHQT